MLLLSGDSAISRVPSPSLLILALVALGSVAGCDREKRSGEQAGAPQANISQGQAGQPADLASFSYEVDRSHKGKAAPGGTFIAPDGRQVRLSDFRGKPMLVNLWATWCAPCLAEMPTLDKLAASREGTMTVIAVAQDLQGAAVVNPWFEKAGLKSLEPYIDADNVLLDAANTALPTTIYYDAQGREIWRVIGAIDWQGKVARALLAETG